MGVRLMTGQIWRALCVFGIVIAASCPSTAQTSQPSVARQSTAKPASIKPHLVALHVDQNDPAIMTLALNNAQNIFTHFKALGRPVKVEIVTYGPGLHMLRDDKSPVKARISSMALEEAGLTFIACANTRDNMAKAEGSAVKIMPEAKVVPSGVVRLMELQATGYAYIKP